MSNRSRLVAPVVLLLTALLAACSPSGQRARSVDAVAAMPASAGPRAQARVATAQPLLKAGAEVRLHERFGVPTFLWASPAGSAAGLAAARASQAASATAGAAGEDPIVATARAHLGTYAGLYALQAADVAGAVASHVHDIGRGPIIVQFKQVIDGAEVFRERASVVMDRQLGLVALSGFLSPAGAQALAPAPATTLDGAGAAAAAVSDLLGGAVDAGALRAAGTAEGGFLRFDLPAGRLTGPARAQPTWFHGPTGLVRGWYVEADAATTGRPELFGYVVSAVDGALLFKADLTADQVVSDAYTYRVFAAPTGDVQNPAAPYDGPQGNLFDPHPTGSADGTQPPGAVPQQDVTLSSSPYCPDPWLPLGATETTGNNVEAYADLVTPDLFTPASADFHAPISGPNAFAYSYDAAQPNALNQQRAAVVQLFYDLNYFHDWYYASGFTEAAGNAQTSNYGRGGLGGDSINAEAQDFASRNNANMSTPADGGRPRMRMYLFDGIAARHLFLSGALTADLATGQPSGWGLPAASAFDVTGSVVWVNDGVGSATYPPATTTTATVHDGCNYTPGPGGAVDPAWASVTGQIAFIDRGGTIAAPATCGFSDKAFNATRAGAIAVIIASTTPHGAASAITMGATAGSGVTTIPAFQLSTPDGDAVRAALANGPVTARFVRAAAVDRDGTLDNQIVAHEWGHYISNRLVGNSSGLTTQMAGGLGEGWADFHALLLTVKEEDAFVPSNAAYGGVYGMAVWTSSGGSNGPIGNQGVYYGIRRMPYSTDLTKNNQTFKNIQDGSAVPVGAPFAFWPAPNTTAANGGNSEVHNTGEVWATMLWECYAELLQDTLGPTPRLTFAQARDRMKDYLVAAYKLTPGQPTLLEARDALLAAAYAGGDLNDYHHFVRGFAKRGAGFGAVAPDRYSTTNNGVIESSSTGVDVAFVGATLTDDVTACDRDGILDSGETGHLTVTLRNDSTQQLTATQATVSVAPGATSQVIFPQGNVITFGATNPGQATTGTVQIALAAGLTGVQPIDLQVDYGDPALAVPNATARWSRRGNVDDLTAQAQVDDVESNLPQFTSTVLGNLPGLSGWFREELDAYHHAYAVTDQNGTTDLALVSPGLVVGTGPFTLTFAHRYAFEASGATLFDGGVVELTADGGNTWTDIGGLATGQAYTAALAGGSPLGTRRAFGGLSPGYPAAWVTTSINLATVYAGKTVRVRFRLGTDSNGRANGWEIDDIAFGGLVNRPFPSLLANKCTGIQTNRRPTVTIGAVPSTPERTLLTLAGTATDLDADPLTVQWSQVSGPAVTLSDTASLTPTFTTPDVDAAGGTVVLGLMAFDGTAWSALVTRSIAVTNVDRPPIASAGADQSVPERTLVTLNGSGFDPDGELVTIAWTQTSGPPVTLLDPASRVTSFVAPDAPVEGAALAFQLAITGGGVTTTSTTTVQVTNVDGAPTAAAGDPQTVDERTAVTLNGAGADAAGHALGYLWIQTAGPGVLLSDATAAAPTFTAPDVGPAGATLAFTLTVTAGGASATSSTTVAVQDVNRTPVAAIAAPAVALEGSTISLVGSASFDPDGALAGYQWTVDAPLPAGAALRDATSPVATFDTGQVGADTQVTFHLVVTDGLTQSVEASVVVTILDLNHAPVAVTGADVTVTSGDTVTLGAGASTDADGQALGYAWRQVTGPAVTLTSATAAAPSFTAPQVTAATLLGFEVTVTDGHGGSTAATQHVLVVPPPAPSKSSGGCSTGGAGSLSLLGLLGLVLRRRRPGVRLLG